MHLSDRPELVHSLGRAGFVCDPESRLWCRPGARSLDYSDQSEDYVLAAVRECADRTAASVELPRRIRDWPSAYHLGRRRSNLLRPFGEWLKGKKVLEIGCGCGALTRYLGEVGASVLAVEGSLARARVARERCSELGNVVVACATSDDLSELGEFDAVLLIGVLEYSRKYLGPDGPQRLLASCRERLGQHGVLLLAIENQLGLKYFAGAPEDHVGIPMYGINRSYSGSSPVTFGRQELLGLLERCGFATSEQYIPLPDYKHPVAIITPLGWREHARSLAPLAIETAGFQVQPIVHGHFSLQQATGLVWDNALAADLANSFLLAASPGKTLPRLVGERVAGFYYSDGRSPGLNKQVRFVAGDAGNMAVESEPLQPGAKAPLQATLLHRPARREDFVEGSTLWHELAQIVNRPGWTTAEVSTWANRWLKAILKVSGHSTNPGRSERVEGRLWDATPFNAVRLGDGSVRLFDQEWAAREPLELGFIAFRGIFHSLYRLSSVARPAQGTPLRLLELTRAVMEGLGLAIGPADALGYLQHDARYIASVTDADAAGLAGAYQDCSLPVRTLPSDYVEEIARLRRRREELEAQVPKLAAQSHRPSAEDDRLTLENHELIAAVDRLTADVQRTAAEAAELRRELQARDSQIGALQEAVEGRDREIARLLGSRSWQATAPLRWTKKKAAQLARTLAWRRFDLTLEPLAEPHPCGVGEWESSTADPAFLLRPPAGAAIPCGWALFEAELMPESRHPFQPVLYLDLGQGFSEAQSIRLCPPRDGALRALLRLPAGIKALRFDPLDRPGRFRLSRVTLERLGRIRGGLHLAAPAATELIAQPDRLPAATRATWKLFQREGLQGLKLALTKRAAISTAQTYRNWIEMFDSLTNEDRAAIAARVESLPSRPLISVLMPVHDPPRKWLERAIASVREQLYPHWELCIADDASTRPYVRTVLERAARADARIKLTFRERNGHISAASNSALALASGEFVALLDHDDELAPQALFALAETICSQPDVDLIYSDEDKIDEVGDRYDPHFKPDWNPDLLDSTNYICHLACFRTSRVREIGGFREGFEGSQDHDLTLRFTAGTSRVVHIPQVLYHWRSIAGSTAADSGNKRYAVAAGVAALRSRHPACEVLEGPFPGSYRVRHPLPSPAPKVSILIPTRDGVRLLRQAIDSLRERTAYPDYEVVVIDNQSRDPETLAYLQGLERTGQARVLRYDAPFNYSAINNLAVRESRGELIALFNDDVEVLAGDWLREMVSHAVRPEIGAVGCKLLYPDDTLQHAGVVLGMGGVAGHIFRRMYKDAPAYFARPQIVQNISVCTGACLVVRKSVYLEVGGLDEVDLKVAFNDADFCLRVAQAGYRNLYTPYACLRHHESASRGSDDTPEKAQRFAREIEVMHRRWGSLLDRDPAHNPNLSLKSTKIEVAWPPRYSPSWRR